MPNCFVVMGFNKKTDPNTGKVFDLDKSYKYIIKPAAKSAGFECVRADEIQHSGVIDVPMYERLLSADLVIADLSTLNPNAFFELGVRYALKPRATICIAESGFKNPFDSNHIVCKSYEHAGDAIDFGEVERMREVLKDACEAARAGDAIDSPVYTFLHELRAPALGSSSTAPASLQTPEERAAQEQARLEVASGEVRRALEEPMAVLIQQAVLARDQDNFIIARAILEGIRQAQGNNAQPFVLQQLALATYKSKQPDPLIALEHAKSILLALDPEHSLDPETIGLWGAVHKRLAELPGRSESQISADIDTAIDALDRGFKLKRDHYNGINLAFMLDMRASRTSGDERIADRVDARRVRRQVADICRAQLAAGIVGDTPEKAQEERFWVKASLAEADLGLGEQVAKERLEAAAIEEKAKDWMIKTARDQLGKVERLLAA
jgi:Tetratricopeptide Repeats-Sensor